MSPDFEDAVRKKRAGETQTSKEDRIILVRTVVTIKMEEEKLDNSKLYLITLMSRSILQRTEH